MFRVPRIARKSRTRAWIPATPRGRRCYPIVDWVAGCLIAPVSRGAAADAGALFHRARATFTKSGARFEVARTYLDLFEWAQCEGGQPAAQYRVDAIDIFRSLAVPRYVQIAEQLECRAER